MDLRERIFGSRKKEFTERDLITVHHLLMVTYGWIPLEEFRKMPISMMFDLLGEIDKQRKAEEKSMKRKR